MLDFDYVIAGAGAAGLSLAYHLNHAGLSDRRVALIERAPGALVDRTWCFWERCDGAFESLVFRNWDRLAFFGQGVARTMEIAPYRYKMIRGNDFARFMRDWISSQPNITLAQGDVTEVTQDGTGACARTADGRVFRGQWAFSSLRLPPTRRTPACHHLLQHFLGWVIHAEEGAFDPGVATLMDFRVEQENDTRFAYVMPFDTHTALVEYTVFSRELLPRPVYSRALEGFIRVRLRIERYEQQYQEFGVIPMTDAPLAVRPSANVINIGMAGGCTKPSTGYTFQRIQRQSRQIAQALRDTGTPTIAAPMLDRRFALFDSVLLNVLDTGRDRGERVFTDLFTRNPPQHVLKFLDEDTTLAEDLRIMGSVNIPAFLTATADRLASRVRRAAG
jgi:lycopene beta-cyclase